MADTLNQQNPLTQQIMQEEEAIQFVRVFANVNQVYCLLSTTQANMLTGVSMPYIGLLTDDRKILFLFSTLELAQAYVDQRGYERLDGIYPIGIANKDDPACSIAAICNTALFLGVNCVDLDTGINGSGLGCELTWFMKVCGIPIEPQMRISNKEMIQLLENEQQNLKYHMNPLPIVQFSNPYHITAERAQEVLMHVGGESFSALTGCFARKENLYENCFLMDYMRSEMLPRAKRELKPDLANYLSEAIKVLSVVIKAKLRACPYLYTLTDKATNRLHIKDESAYLLYTGRFRYMGEYGYRKLNGLEDLHKLITLNGLKHILVTDGPHFVARLDAEIFLGK